MSKEIGRQGPAPRESAEPTEPSVGELWAEGRRRLQEAPFGPASREALLLLSRALELSEAQVFSRRDEPVPPTAAARFRSSLERRLTGEPVAYILGEKEFYGRLFAVDRRVLIPRPETEHLMEAALALALPPRPRILDLGTGSGCLAVTLACERPRARVVAIDASPGALAVAGANSRQHGVASRVALVASHWADALDAGAFDLVVANPPYIDPAQVGEISAEILDHEPHGALFAGPGGLDAYRHLLASLAEARPATPLLLEIGVGQLSDLEALAATQEWEVTGAVEDYARIPRIATLRRR